MIIVECPPVGDQGGVHRDPNAIAAHRAARYIFFFKRVSKDGGGKHVIVKTRQHQDILRFRTDARKLDVRVHRDLTRALKVHNSYTILFQGFRFRRP